MYRLVKNDTHYTCVGQCRHTSEGQLRRHGRSETEPHWKETFSYYCVPFCPLWVFVTYPFVWVKLSLIYMVTFNVSLFVVVVNLKRHTLIFFYCLKNSVDKCLWVGMCTWVQCPHSPEEGTGSPGVTSNCKLPIVGAGSLGPLQGHQALLTTE